MSRNYVVRRRSGIFTFSLAIAVIAATSLPADDKPKATKEKWNVAIVVHENVELLDFAGPGEVFASAGNRSFNVYTVGESTKPIRSQRFLTVTPQYSIANCPKPDIVVIPGGETPVLLRNPDMMKWIRTSAENADIMFSVCTGAFALAEAGLLDGLEATTHHSSISGLKRYSKIKVLENKRVVDNGKIVTAAGVSAGIDGALHIVSRLCGLEAAKRTAHYMEYKWEPIEAVPTKTSPPTDVAAHQAWCAGQWKDAEKLYQQLAFVKPNDGVTYYRLGFCQLRQRKHEAALESLQKAIDAGHRYGETIGQLGLAQSRMQKWDDAAKSLELAKQIGESGWGYCFELAKIYADLGKKEQSLSALEAAFNGGMVGVEQILVSEEFDSIRGEKRFRDLIRGNCFGHQVQIASDKEPGERLIVSGVLKNADGKPIPEALIYYYHTDAKGNYTRGSGSGAPDSRLFCYLRTDGLGRYELNTIRPGGYPESRIPQHVHYEVILPGQKNFVSEFFFADDSRLTEKDRQQAERDNMMTKPIRDGNGVQQCRYDIIVKN